MHGPDHLLADSALYLLLLCYAGMGIPVRAAVQQTVQQLLVSSNMLVRLWQRQQAECSRGCSNDSARCRRASDVVELLQSF
jgi:hypothetical protein